MSVLGLEDLEAWRADAECTGVANAVFFPPVESPDATAEAKAICAGCAAQPLCLGYALTNYLDHGVWGGTTGTERIPVLRAALAMVANGVPGREAT